MNSPMKKRILCAQLPKPGRPSSLSEAEGHHALRVLRLRDGQCVEAMDGQGHHTLATLRIKGGKPFLEALESDAELGNQPPVAPFALQNLAVEPLPLVLEAAILKGVAMEWLVEKAVELGVKQLIPVLTDHTVVQTKLKGGESFRIRWQKIADQALKQCGRLTAMKISAPIELTELLSQDPLRLHVGEQRLWCDENAVSNAPFLLRHLNTNSGTLPAIRLLIGPEGGWSAAERDLLLAECQISATHRVHLGPAILRAETAGLYAVSVCSGYFLASEGA